MDTARICISNSAVGIVKIPARYYSSAENDFASLEDGIQRLANWMGWSNPREPFGAILEPGARVLVKPNLVKHLNEGQGGLQPLVTHPSVIRAVVEAALRSQAGDVLVGDAPLQSCDLPALLRSLGLLTWSEKLASTDRRFRGVYDFRRTTCIRTHGVRVPTENRRPLDHFVLFDLGCESLLEPVTQDGTFRVSNYDPRLLHRTHTQGVHRYLIAREVLEADLIIDLPKLKTHKKAGLTCALKNFVGINGNKEYLPHHRLGGSSAGGDCYPGNSAVKQALEYLADRENLASSTSAGAFWHLLSRPLGKTLQWRGDRVGTDGSWSGNDTIWRTCLDLNRILIYGKADGNMSDEPQRRVIHLVDAVIAGHGDGPLAPDPLPLGIMLAGENAAAIDWIAAQLLSYDPADVPLVMHAFDRFRWPLASFSSVDVRSMGDLGESSSGMIRTGLLPEAVHPAGWQNVLSYH